MASMFNQQMMGGPGAGQQPNSMGGMGLNANQNPQGFMMGGNQGPQAQIAPGLMMNQSQPNQNQMNTQMGNMGGAPGGGMMQSNMSGPGPTGPSPDKKLPPLKINLAPREKGFFSNLLSQADPNGNNKVGGQEGVTFLKRSGLAVDVLKNIWKTAARTSPEFLTRDEFYIALRLIAYAQNGIKPNEESIQFDIPVDLPRFDPAPLAITAPSYQKEKPEINSVDIASQLPDLDNLNLDALNSIQSLIPSINQKEQQKQMQQMQAQVMRNQQMMQKNMIDQARQSPWFISQEELQKYQKIFDHFDSNKVGTLDETHMQGVFKQTQLPQDIQQAVWQLVNPNNSDKFNKKMFIMAMHLLYKKKQGSELPPRIPQEMLISIDPQGFMHNQQQNQQQQQMGGLPQSQMNQQQQMNAPQNNQIPTQQQQNILQPPQQPSQQQQPQQQLQQQSLINLNDHSPSQNQFQTLPSQAQQNDLSRSQIPAQPRPLQQQNLLDLSSPVKVQHVPQQLPTLQQNNSSSNHKRNASSGNNFEHAHQQNRMGPQHSFDLAQSMVPYGQNTNIPQVTQNQIQARQDDVNFLQSVHKQDNQTINDLYNDNYKLKVQLDDLDKEFSQLKTKIAEQRKLLEEEKKKNQNLRNSVDERIKTIQREKQVYENVISERMTQYEQSAAQQQTYQTSTAPALVSQNNNDYYQDNTQNQNYGYDYNNDYNASQSYNKQDTYNNNSAGNGGAGYQQDYYNYDYSQQNNTQQNQQQYASSGQSNQQQQQQQQWVSFDDGGAASAGASDNAAASGFDFGGAATNSKFEYDNAYGNENGGGQQRFDFS